MYIWAALIGFSGFINTRHVFGRETEYFKTGGRKLEGGSGNGDDQDTLHISRKFLIN